MTFTVIGEVGSTRIERRSAIHGRAILKVTAPYSKGGAKHDIVLQYEIKPKNNKPLDWDISTSTKPKTHSIQKTKILVTAI